MKEPLLVGAATSVASATILLSMGFGPRGVIPGTISHSPAYGTSSDKFQDQLLQLFKHGCTEASRLLVASLLHLRALVWLAT